VFSPFDNLFFPLGRQHCPHAACPVPVGIIKAIEVEAELAIPADVTIKLSQAENIAGRRFFS
jgi:hypothetical protein